MKLIFKLSFLHFSLEENPILSTKAVNQQISSFFSVTYLSTTSNLAVKDLVLDIRKDALAMKLK